MKKKRFKIICRKTKIVKMISKRRRFVFYMCYAWGLPFLLTMITIILDRFRLLPERWSPGIGTIGCFLKSAHSTRIYLRYYHGIIHINSLHIISDEKLSPFIYFYMFICIIFLMNIIFFVSTALKIRQAQRDISTITSQAESGRHQSHLNNQKDK